MKTIKYKLNSLMVIVLLLVSSFIMGQDYAYHSQTDIALNERNYVTSSENLDDFVTYLFLTSLVSNNNFNYRRALRESKENPVTLSIGNSTIQSPELLKVFKKAARKSDTLETFKRILFEKQVILTNNLTDGQVEDLYISFRSSTFNGLLDELHQSFASY